MKILFIILAVILGTSVAGWNNQQKIKGSGYVRTEQRTVKPFSQIAASRAIKVFVAQGEQTAITVEADDNILPYIKTEVSGNLLTVSLPQNISIESYADMNVLVTIPTLTDLQSSTASKIEGTTLWKVNEIELSASTAGTIKLETEASEIDAKSSTSGEIRLTGKTTGLDAKASTAGSVRAKELIATDADVSASTGGEIEIHVTGKLEYSASTGGEIRYKGDARLTGKTSTGGDIKKDR